MYELHSTILNQTHSFAPVLILAVRYLERVQASFRALEWGPGESTGIILGSKKCSGLVSLENDAFWYSVAEDCYVADRRLLLVRVPPPVGYDRLCSYVMAYSSSRKFDLVMVDGFAYRSECLLRSKSLVSRSGLVLLHDYPNMRPGDRDGPLDAPGCRVYERTLPISIRQFRHHVEFREFCTTICSQRSLFSFHQFVKNSL